MAASAEDVAQLMAAIEMINGQVAALSQEVRQGRSRAESAQQEASLIDKGYRPDKFHGEKCVPWAEYV